MRHPDYTSLAIMGAGVLGLAWLFWCTWHGVDPIGLLR